MTRHRHAYWANMSESGDEPPRWSMSKLLFGLVPVLLIGILVLCIVAIIAGAKHRARDTHACNAAGGYVPFPDAAPVQCVREGKPVPDSLWRSR